MGKSLTSVESVTFPYYASYKLHMRAHNKEKPYYCTECDYASNSASHLKRHQSRVHRKEKKYSCEFCGKKCFDAPDLARHIRHPQKRNLMSVQFVKRHFHTAVLS